MINLLSPADKRELRAARRNVLLLRYNIVVIFVIFAVGLVYSGSFFITMREKTIAEQQLQEDQVRTNAYAGVRTKATQFSKNLTTAKTILANEVRYSTLITDIAKVLPSGTVLTALTIGPDSFGKSQAINASAISYTKALELKKKLEDSPFYSDVSITSVNRGGEGQLNTQAYPVAVVFNATFISITELKKLRQES